MRKITYLPKPMDLADDKRLETGPLQVGDDWPGFFIRGDQALHFAHMLQQHLRKLFPEVENADKWDAFEQGQLMGWAILIEACNAKHASKPAPFAIVPIDTLTVAYSLMEFASHAQGIKEMTDVEKHLKIVEDLLPEDEPSELG